MEVLSFGVINSTSKGFLSLGNQGHVPFVFGALQAYREQDGRGEGGASAIKRNKALARQQKPCLPYEKYTHCKCSNSGGFPSFSLK